MKLASYKDGSRDGQLLVVSRDLGTAHYATGIATRLQQVLDDWNFLSPQLEALSQDLNHGKARHAFAFEPGRCAAPLPRAYRWAQAEPEGAAGGEPASRPRMRQHSADDLWGPRDLVSWPAGTALELVGQARLAVISGDLAPGCGPAASLEGVRLLVLMGSLTLRDSSAPARHAVQLGAALAPVVATPDEAGPAWQQGRLHLRLDVHHNGRGCGSFDTACAPGGHFADLLTELARHRGIRSGGIVGGCPIGDAAVLQPGDTLKLEVRTGAGPSLFGAIDLVLGSSASPA